MSKWNRFYRNYTTEEVKLLVFKVVQASLEICFNNHIYQCCNELYKQRTGGGIGARVTGVVAGVDMDTWADLLAIDLEGGGVILYLIAKYVDDINLAVLYIE